MTKRIEEFLQNIIKFESESNTEKKLQDLAAGSYEKYKVFPYSIHCMKDGCIFVMLDDNDCDSLVVSGSEELLNEFTGERREICNFNVKICPANCSNIEAIAKRYPFVKPVSHKSRSITMGLGDRLGLASAAHIRLLRGYDVFPVLAQQSIRELKLTDRTYADVLAAASWDVFKEGWTRGFGADGDHLKTPEEVKMALDYGYTMITLDCSEHIDNSIGDLDDDQVHKKYLELPLDERCRLELDYLNKTFKLKNGLEISFTSKELERAVLVYLKATCFTVDLYTKVIKNCGREIDFEMSIDETLTPTKPHDHFFVASELVKGGVDITSLAPRFCGEFQKGIDYMGDVAQFEREYVEHTAIAEYFNYKLSIHSGSDKFSVFPIIGKCSNGKYHLKTAGTNWLEAVRIIAMKDPKLFRRMYSFAMDNLDEAKKYYHISTSTKDLQSIDMVSDNDLAALLDNEAIRQLMHVTYGLILCAKNSDGSFTFRDEFYKVMRKNAEAYSAALNRHIGRHLEYLGLKSTNNN